MIRINLLKPLQAQEPMLLLDEPKKGSRRLLLVLLAVVAIGAGIYELQQAAEKKSAPVAPVASAPTAAPTVTTPKASEPPKTPAAAPKHVTADAVEEIVREARTERATDTAAPAYANLAPSQRIAFQHLAGSRMLRDLQAVTPPEIGFAEVIFTPPGEFYVHGLAATDDDLKRFQNTLAALPGAEVRQSLSQAVGTGKIAREFSFFGKMSYPTSEVAQTENHVVAQNRLEAVLKEFTGSAKASGVELQAPKLQKSSASGGLQRMLYKTEARCDFARMESFLEKLRSADSNVGLVRLALEAKGDEKMVASLDLLVYAQ